MRILVYVAALALTAAVFYLAGRWSGDRQSPQPVAVSGTPGTEVGARLDAMVVELRSIRGGQAALEQRLSQLETRPAAGEDRGSTGDIEARLDALELAADAPRDSGLPQRDIYTTEKYESMDYADSDSYAQSIREAFENDDNADPELRAELEDAESLFDREVVDKLEFAAMDCRKTYCRLQYNDYSESRAEAGLQENELLLLLSERYGEDIIVHGGEREGDSRTFYIELDAR